MPISYSSQIFKIPANMTCLCTVITNTTATPKWVLVPNHGTLLGPNEQLVIFGDYLQWLQHRRRRTQFSIMAALESDTLDIVQTPAVHITDGTVTKIVTLNAMGGVDVANPCWE